MLFRSAPACSPEEQERIRKHNALIPDNKPLFMRHIYNAMDSDLTRYDKSFDNVGKYNGGFRLAELLDTPYERLADEDKLMVDKYYRYLPAIDSHCTMNKICKRFERLQKNLKRCKGARNMLLDFTTPQELDAGVLEQMAELVDLLQRQKRFIARANNTTDANSNKQIAKDTKERLDALYSYKIGRAHV